MGHLSLNEALTWLCFTTDVYLPSPSLALLILLPFHPPTWNPVVIPGTKTCKWGVLLNWYCQMWCEQVSCTPLISDTDDYAGAVPKARKGQALLPVDFHVFFPARQDCKLNFWDQGKSIFILFQLFQISYLRTILHVRILVSVYCVLCLWEIHRNAIFSLPYFARCMHSHQCWKQSHVRTVGIVRKHYFSVSWAKAFCGKQMKPQYFLNL